MLPPGELELPGGELQQRITRTLAWIIAAGLIAAGCSSWPTGPDPVGQPDYPERTSPENAIAKFVMAYEAMDADEYLDCLSDDFLFFVNPDDTHGYQPLPESWGRAVEDTIAQRMFRDSSGIDSIRVELTQDGDPVEIPGQEPGDPSWWRYTEDAMVSQGLPPPGHHLPRRLPGRFPHTPGRGRRGVER